METFCPIDLWPVHDLGQRSQSAYCSPTSDGLQPKPSLSPGYATVNLILFRFLLVDLVENTLKQESQETSNPTLTLP